MNTRISHVLFLDTFVKLWKVTSSFIMSIHPSIHPYGTAWVQLDKFSWNLIFEYFLKMCWGNSNSIEVLRITGTLHEDKYTFMIVSHSVVLRMTNVWYKICTENQTHILYSFIFFHKPCSLWDNVENYCKAGRATGENIVHEHCMLGT